MFEVPKIKKIEGEIFPRGDKSISHRVVIFSALSRGKVLIKNISSSDDVAKTISIFSELGVRIEEARCSDDIKSRHVGGRSWRGRGDKFKYEQGKMKKILVEGVGKYLSGPPSSVLYAGNSGTTARILSTVLSAQKFPSVLDGDESLRRRPMRRVVEPLRKIGAKIWGRENGEYLPLLFDGAGRFSGGDFDIKPSAQVKTALLIANFWSDSPVKVRETIRSRDHTERLLPYFSARMNFDEHGFMWCEADELSPPDTIYVPGDISSSAFLVVLAILTPGSNLNIKDVLLNPLRAEYLNLLRKMGADVRFFVEREELGEPVGYINVSHSHIRNISLSGDIIPSVIDEIPILAFAGFFGDGIFSVRDAKELRVKETDRIHAICSNLRVLGVDVVEYDDGFEFEGLGERAYLKDGNFYFRSFGDHRIAMSLFVLGSLIRGRVFIDDISCVSVSYADFLDDLNKLAVFYD